MLPAWHLLGLAHPLLAWSNSSIMSMHLIVAISYLTIEQNRENSECGVQHGNWLLNRLIKYVDEQTRRLCLILICGKSTCLRNILLYCWHISRWYKYVGIHITVCVRTNTLIYHMSIKFSQICWWNMLIILRQCVNVTSGWYYSASMLWCQALIKYVNTSRGPSAFGRSTKLNDKPTIWSRLRLRVDTHQGARHWSQ